ncbi:MAG: aminoglycoside 3'-phosphotransferase [Defluviitaleaceae bacterium]|nr:aminoglycoside 3'-phosphotransferase [Defluviitaleaceae bacterium]
MTQIPITVDITTYPAEIQPLLRNAKLYESNGHSGAATIFIDKDAGYFLKSAPVGTLERQAAMTRFFHSKGLSTAVLAYLSHENRDWLLTEKVAGDVSSTTKYLENPTRLADTLAQQMALLHATDFTDCPVPDHTTAYLASAKRNYVNDTYDKSHFPDSHGYQTPAEAWAAVEAGSHRLGRETLLHGDFCLPNIMLDNWKFSGFIDLDGGGVGDRHVDIFWALWSLWYNLKTDAYRDRFIDAYGRGRVDKDMLRTVAAVETFG